MAWISGNRFLTRAEMQNNAEYVKDYGLSQGWSVNAIAAILGNMEAESTINPGIWGDNGHAYGLVQWNPYTKYSNWAGAGWRNNGQRELERISYEADHNLQWGYNDTLGSYPPYSLNDFLYDETSSVETLARYWCYYYENPDNPVAKGNDRAARARYWLNYFDWDDPPIPPDPDPPDPDDPEPPNPDDPDDPDTPPDPPEPDPGLKWIPPWMFINLLKRSVNNACPVRLHIYKRK